MQHYMASLGYVQTSASVECEIPDEIDDGNRIFCCESWGFSGWSIPDRPEVKK